MKVICNNILSYIMRFFLISFFLIFKKIFYLNQKSFLLIYCFNYYEYITTLFEKLECLMIWFFEILSGSKDHWNTITTLFVEIIWDLPVKQIQLILLLKTISNRLLKVQTFPENFLLHHWKFGKIVILVKMKYKGSISK